VRCGPQQHQVAAALPQRLGGKQEHPDARRIHEIQSAHVNSRVQRPVSQLAGDQLAQLLRVSVVNLAAHAISGPDSPAVTDPRSMLTRLSYRSLAPYR
jgi:hypothetical protein